MSKYNEPIHINPEALEELRSLKAAEDLKETDRQFWHHIYEKICLLVPDQEDPRSFFFRQAAEVNRNDEKSPANAFIRTYMETSLRLQGYTFSKDGGSAKNFIQRASNNIGSAIVAHVVDKKHIPPVGGKGGLWTYDIQHGFKEVKDEVNIYAAWGGGPFAAYLGIEEFEKHFSGRPDLQEIMIKSTNEACLAAGWKAVGRPSEMNSNNLSLCLANGIEYYLKRPILKFFEEVGGAVFEFLRRTLLPLDSIEEPGKYPLAALDTENSDRASIT